MEIKLNQSNPDERLDKALRRQEDYPLAFISRAAWDELFEAGKIKSLTGKRLKPSQAVGELKAIEVDLPSKQIGILEDQTNIEIILETPDLLIVNKNSCLHSYPLRPWENGTLANRVAHYLAEQKKLIPDSFAKLAEAPILECGLVQRLDFDTSGLLGIALTKSCKQLLRKEISHVLVVLLMF